MKEVLILMEPAYSGSVWCGNMLHGLEGELKQKRMPYKRIASLKEAEDGCEYIFIMATDNNWVGSVMNACNAMGIYPILLSNQIYRKFDINYSTVCSDISGSMRLLVKALRSIPRGNIALYGVNPQSASDEGRSHSF